MLNRCLAFSLVVAKQMTLVQIWIVITSCLSISLITDSDPALNYVGMFVGLAGQPAWVQATLRGGQPGMLIVSVVFTYSYLRGIFPSLPGLF